MQKSFRYVLHMRVWRPLSAHRCRIFLQIHRTRHPAVDEDTIRPSDFSKFHAREFDFCGFRGFFFSTSFYASNQFSRDVVRQKFQFRTSLTTARCYYLRSCTYIPLMTIGPTTGAQRTCHHDDTLCIIIYRIDLSHLFTPPNNTIYIPTYIRILTRKFDIIIPYIIRKITPCVQNYINNGLKLYRTNVTSFLYSKTNKS